MLHRTRVCVLHGRYVVGSSPASKLLEKREFFLSSDALYDVAARHGHRGRLRQPCGSTIAADAEMSQCRQGNHRIPALWFTRRPRRELSRERQFRRRHIGEATINAPPRSVVRKRVPFEVVRMETFGWLTAVIARTSRVGAIPAIGIVLSIRACLALERHSHSHTGSANSCRHVGLNRRRRAPRWR